MILFIKKNLGICPHNQKNFYLKWLNDGFFARGFKGMNSLVNPITYTTQIHPIQIHPFITYHCLDLPQSITSYTKIQTHKMAMAIIMALWLTHLGHSHSRIHPDTRMFIALLMNHHIPKYNN